MVDFFETMYDERDEDAATALAMAKRKFIEESDEAHAHPRFWAPFIVLGNGSTQIHGPISKAYPAELQFKSLDDPGGEIVSSKYLDSGGVIHSRMGDFDGIRRNSHVEKRSQDGKVAWQNVSRPIGTGEVIESDGQIYASGDLSNTDGTRLTPILRAFDLEGEELWSWLPSPQKGSDWSFIASMDIAKDGVVVLIKSRAPKDNISDHAYYYLVHINSLGNVKSERKILRRHDYATSLFHDHIIEMEDRTILFLGGANFVSPEEAPWSDFGLVTLCDNQETEVIVVYHDEAISVSRSLIPGLLLRGATRRENINYIFGSRQQPCEMVGSAVLGTVSSTGEIKSLHVVDELLGSTFVNMDDADGKIVLSGEWSRRFSDRVSMSLDEILARPVDQLVSEDYTIIEGFFDVIDQGRLERRVFLSAGTSIFLGGLDLNDNTIQFSGSVGQHPLMGSFRYPEGF